MGGFVREGSSDDYVLLGGGGHKLLSEIRGTIYDAEIEYLESTGTQYIDTGVYLDTNDFEIGYEIFGNYLAWGFAHQMVARGTWIGVSSDWTYFGTWMDANKISISTSATENIIKYESQRGLTVNGTFYSKTLSMGSDSITAIPLYIYADYDFYSKDFEYSSSKLKTLYIKKNGILVRDFIPVRVGNVGYLYDKVSCQLFGNSGTGNFVLGPDVSIHYGAEVEYLEDTGSCGINTGIIPNASTKVQFKLMRLDNSANSVFGCGNDDLNDWRFFFYSNKAYFDTYGGTSGWGKRIISSTSYTINNIYSFEIGNYYIKDLDTGNTVASSDTYSGSNAQNIFLYGGFKIRLYYIKIYDGTTLVRDFIPVRVGQVGYMYDKVSGKLFSNSGTGSFIVGPYKDHLPLTGGTLTGQVGATGFVKSSSSDSYVLLGGGGHKLLSEFLLFPPLTGHAERFRFKATNFAWFSTGSVKVPFLVRGGVQEEIFFPVFSSFGIIHIHAGNYTVGMQGWGWWCLGDSSGVSVNYNTNGGYLHISISKSGSGWNVYYYVPFVVYANGLNYQGTATLEDQYVNSGMFALD